jgi:hypothetical protein
LLLLVGSLVMQFYASAYATTESSHPVTDIILSNTRVYDVDGLFVYGSVVVFLFVLYLVLSRPGRMPFVIKSISTLLFVRSIFVILTHIGPFSPHVVISSTFFQRSIFSGFFTGADLFFSGHTGTPFLLALIFWDDKLLRYIFLACSLMFAGVVLLGHIHYSIDVLAAFFITYAIFDICKWLFKKDRELFLKTS